MPGWHDAGMKLRGSAAVVVLLLTAACGGSTGAVHASRVPSSSVGSAGFQSDAQRDGQFIDALSGSPNAQEYTSASREDLLRLGRQMCDDIATGHSVQSVVRAKALTPDSTAVAFLVRTAVGTYCPNFAWKLPDLVGP